MARLFWKFIFWIAGWKVVGKPPADIPKIVCVAGPHTSKRDMWLTLGSAAIVRTPIHFLVKKELLEKNILQSWAIKRMGAVGIDRSQSSNLVDQVVKVYKSKDRFALGITPEGTRKKVDKLKTGFWYIAKEVGCPIVMIGFDYRLKEVQIKPHFYVSDDMDADIQKVWDFFASVTGRYPEHGVGLQP